MLLKKILAFGLFAASFCLPAQSLPTGVTKLSTVEGITEYRLPNGLAVLLFPDDTKPLITVNMTYRVGSKHENYGETGMAHLLEHLLFKGTPTIPKLSEEMNRRGFRMNGTTYYDRTNYHETFNANEAHLDWAVRMEADRMVNSFIAKTDLDSEMNVVWDELRRGENNPGRVLNHRMMAAAFDWHNYGKPTIGAPSDLENVSIEKLQAFYKLYYQPDNAVLTVAGRFEVSKTLALIVDAFKTVEKPNRTLPKLYTLEPTQDGERRVTVRRVGDATTVAAQYHLPAASHTDSAALALLANILGTEPSGRLYAQLNEPGLAANSYAYVNALAERSVLAVGAQIEGKQTLAAAEAALLKATESVKTISAEELKRAIQENEAEFNQLLKSPETIAIALSESIGHGDWRLLFAQREAVKRVTAAEIARVAGAYLKPDNRTVGVFIPTERPNRAAIAATVDAKALADATTFAAPRKQGERFDPSPAALEARTLRGALSAGTPYLALSKQNRGDAVTLHIQLRWGNKAAINAAHNANKGKESAAWVAAMLLEGSEGLSKQAFADALSQLKTVVNIQSGATGATITVVSEQANVIPTLKLLDTVLKKPSFEPAALERLRSASLASLAAQLQDPEAKASEAIAQRNNLDKGLTPTDWRYALSTEQTIAATKALQLPHIKQAYRDFWTTQHASVSAVGTLPDGLKPALDSLLAGWSASPAAAKLPYERQTNPHVAGSAFANSIQLNDKTNAVYAAQGAFALKRSDEHYWPLQIGSYVLGGDPFTSRIGKRVRVTEGLSYGAGSYISVDTRDDRAVYAAYASFAPKNLAKVQQAMREELERILTEGITDKELADTQAYLLQTLEQQRASDAYLAGHLLYQQEMGLNFDIHTQHSQRIKSATVDSVNAALRQYLSRLPMIAVSAGDWTK
jgi:zinc protease